MLTRTYILFIGILTLFPHQFTSGNYSNEFLSARDSMYFIYAKTLEVNKLINKGEHALVIETANALIDSFPSYIIETPYFGYLCYYKASAYRSLGSYYLSEKHYRLANNRFIYEKDIETYISSQNNLAITLMESGKYDQSIQLLKRLLRKYPESISKKNLSNIYGNLAALGLRVNDTALCNDSFHKIFKLNSGSSKDEYAYFISERNYGRYFNKLNRFKESETYLRNALSGSIDSLGLNHFQTGLCFKHLGDLFHNTVQEDSAIHYYSKALDIFENKNEVDKPDINPQYETVLIECLKDYGNTLVHLNDPVNGLEMFKKGIERLQYLAHSVMIETNRFIIAEKGRIVFNHAISTALDLHKKTGDQGYLEQAFEWSLQAKSFSLYWLGEKELIYKKLNINGELVIKLKGLRHNLDDLFSRLLPDDDSVAKISQLLREYEKTELLISKNYPDIKKENQKISFRNLIRESLEKNENYISYFDTGKKIIVFCIKSEDFSYIDIPRDKNLIKSVSKIKTITSNSPNRNYTRNDINEYSTLSNSLFQILLKPLIVESDETIVIHPDGLLLGLSFEALTTKPTIEETFADLPYLLRSYEIRYAALPFIHNKSAELNDNKKLTIITCKNPQGANMLGIESEDIQKIFPKSDLIYLDDIGFDPDLLSMDGKIHISSHLIREKDNPLGAGLSCSSSENNSSLTFEDILYLNLNGSNVFINACESGSGPVNQGEGLMSLGLAFAVAGCSSIIQHMWEAPDHGSHSLSLEYYKTYSKNNPSESLRKAKLKYLENCDYGYDHPYYWAGLICYGESTSSRNYNFFYIFFVSLALAGFIAIMLVIRAFRQNS